MLSVHVVVIIVIVVVVIIVIVIVVIVVVVDNIDDLDCNGSEGLDKDKKGKDGEGLLALRLVTVASVSGRQIDVLMKQVITMTKGIMKAMTRVLICSFSCANFAQNAQMHKISTASVAGRVTELNLQLVDKCFIQGIVYS